jgi:hypothetical protein
MIYSDHCKSFMRLNRIEFSLNALGKKKAPTPLQVEAEVCASWPYGGRSPPAFGCQTHTDQISDRFCAM